MTFRRVLAAQPITAAAVLGFALTLGVWLVAGYFFTHRISAARTRADTVTERYMAAQEQLSNVNSQILLGSVYIRDALMDAASLDHDARPIVEDTFNAVGSIMDRYIPVLDSADERDRIGRLHIEIDEFKRRMIAVLEKASAGSAQEARGLLRTQVVPKRETVIRMSEEVRALNRQRFVRQQTEIAAIYADSQRWFWSILTLAMAASFGIALVAVRHAGRLEHRLQQQAVSDARNAAELQRLSAKLITTQEEDRRTLARELHDEVGQAVTAIKVELAVAQRTILAAGLPGELLNSPRAIADGTLGTIRDLSHLLRPPLLDDLGLVQAIQLYVETFNRRHAIVVALDVATMTTRLPASVETAVYRIVQEALTNVARHARAQSARVSLAHGGQALTLVIEDDGTGFELSELNRIGLGIVGMRERAFQLHGTFSIHSNHSRGTRIVVMLPTAGRTAAAETGVPDSSLPPLAEAHE